MKSLLKCFPAACCYILNSRKCAIFLQKSLYPDLGIDFFGTGIDFFQSSKKGKKSLYPFLGIDFFAFFFGIAFYTQGIALERYGAHTTAKCYYFCTNMNENTV